tara:strand:+ start:459 stop:1571 length:1113 start_codon:yes stop_codon:yes gene_type:complete
MKIYKIKVNTKNKKYSLIIGSDIIHNITNILSKENLIFKKCLLIIDKNIPKNKQIILKKKLNLKVKKVITFKFNANEKNKNYNSIEKIHRILFKKRFNREDCIISFGGGITGDIVGFAASTFKRGMKFINIPTTLLSQVDSSIGGKTGINNIFGKNLVGSFYQPDLVISDIKILNSLPYRELVCGYAEILKSSLIQNYKNFNFLDKNINQILRLKSPFIERAIIDSCKLKKKIVEKDEKEKNLRKVLNLGHTFAHAYESTLKFSKKLNHGEAVIIGIKNAINFSNKNKILTNKKFKLINNHIDKIGLNHKFNKLFKKKDIKNIIYFMKSDKKNISNNINIILIKDFGKIITNYQVSSKKLEHFLVGELNK